MQSGRRYGRTPLSICRCFLGKLLIPLVLFPVALIGNPTGGELAAGSAQIATVPGAVTVTQSSAAAIINWQSFSINAGELTRFVQPSSTSAVLNRVLGGQTSIINGTLSANGQVYLINGNGIVVGAHGVVNTGSFTASTRDISDADFLARNLHFTGASQGGVQNLGRITALEGDVVLIGKTVDNQGAIHAKGTAGLVAADDVTLAQKNADGSTILVRPSASATSDSGRIGVHNSGTIIAATAELKAANGNIYALAIQNEGAIRATAGVKQGGRVWLTSSGGSIINSGLINVSSRATGGHGGNVTIQSQTGTVTQSGQIVSQGGSGGAGGNADISGAHVHISGTIDLSSPGGGTGTLLIDPPTTLTIAHTGGDFTPADVVAMLALANVTFSADSTITVTDAVNASANTDAHVLTLDAPTVDLNQAITLDATETLAGTATTVNVGANGLVQNGIDVASSTTPAMVNLADMTYTLTGSQLLINKSLTLEGNGAILNGNNASRVMEIDGATGGTVTVTLDDLTVENGDGVQGNNAGAAGSSFNASGGGILIYAESGRKTNVTLENSTVTRNTVNAAMDFGGGIDNDGSNSGSATLNVINSTISYNVAVLQAQIAADGATGGGIFNNALNSGTAILSITASSTLNYNTADATVDGLYGSGGAIFNEAEFSGTATVTIDDTTLTHNTSDYGGSIYNDNENSGNASLIIRNNSVLSDNLAEQNGGAFFNDDSPLTVTDSTISNNRANYVGGVTEASGDLLTFTNDMILDNTAAYGGGAIYHDGSFTATASDLVLTNCTFTGNVTGVYGGALCNDGGGIDDFGAFGGANCEITSCTFTGNVAEYGAAILNDCKLALSVVTVTDSTITGNGTAAATAAGGGLMNRTGSGTHAGPGGSIQVIDSTISGNAAGNGAGIYSSSGPTSISGSLITGNTATADGGGIFNTVSFLSVINSTVSDNTAGVSGGGLYTQGADTVMVSGSLFSNNTATANGGGIVAFGLTPLKIQSSTLTGNSATNGGGIYITSTPGGAVVTLTGVTLVGNTATTSGGGIYNFGGTGPATIQIDGSIISDNKVGGSESDYFATGMTTFTDIGYNIYGQNGVAGGFSPAVSTDILLSGGIGTVLATNGGALVLQNNGGPTYTIALISGSIAINAGNPADDGTTDQRGISRGSAAAFTGSAPDIGAYEAQLVSVKGNDITVTYGTAVPTPSYTIVNGPSNAASLVSGAVAIVTPETQAAVYANDIGQGTIAVAGPTYFLDFIPGTLTISPAPLTITANDAHLAYSGTAYSGGNGVTYNGFVNGQNASVLQGALSYGGTSQGAIDSGQYTITVSGQTDSNYAIADLPGFLFIDPLASIPPLQPVNAVSGLVEDERRKIELYPGDGAASYFYEGNWSSGRRVIAEMSSADVTEVVR